MPDLFETTARPTLAIPPRVGPAAFHGVTILSRNDLIHLEPECRERLILEIIERELDMQSSPGAMALRSSQDHDVDLSTRPILINAVARHFPFVEAWQITRSTPAAIAHAVFSLIGQ